MVRARVAPRLAAFDAVIAGLVLALALGLAASSFLPTPITQLVAPGLDLVLETVTTTVAFAVAALGWVQYRQQAEPLALFRAAAFLVLGVANGLGVALAVMGLDAPTGMSPAAPGQAPIYVVTLARAAAAGLLIWGGIASLRDRHPSRPGTVVLGAVAGTLVMIAAIEIWAGSLPPLAATGAAGPSPASTLLGAATHVLVSGLFLWAAALSRRLYRRDGSAGHLFLTVGLVFGAFAEAHAVIDPATYAGLVTAGDGLRLAFDVSLLIGILVEEGATLAGLRDANVDLERVRAQDVQRATLEERAHLARELHDGLAQNLWLAKLKAGRLAAVSDLGTEAQALVGELGGAIDSGLAEAQQAVAALRIVDEPAGPLWDVIEQYVDDFADRFGFRAEVDCPTGRSGLAPRAEAELLRIAQEALNNVRRHADATVVRVQAAIRDGQLELLVRDNGRGFDPEAVGEGSFGLASMRERAALLGGELSIDSRPQDGTRIRVLVPLPQVALSGTGSPWS
ncbi:MAG: sensor histidine kinase [Chloroflexota bacterium]